MAGPVSLTRPANSLFNPVYSSAAGFLIDSLQPKEEVLSSIENSQKNDTTQSLQPKEKRLPSERASSSSIENSQQSDTTPKNLAPSKVPFEIWFQIARIFSIDTLGKFGFVSSSFFKVVQALIFNASKPKLFGGKAFIPGLLANDAFKLKLLRDTAALVALPYSKEIETAYGSANFEHSRHRLVRELCSLDGLKRVIRGNAPNIAKLLLSVSTQLSIQDLIDIELFDSEAFANLDPSTPLSTEKSTHILNHSVALSTQKTPPNLEKFQQIPDQDIKLGIPNTPNEISRDLMFKSVMFYQMDALHWAASNNRLDRLAEALEAGVGIDTLNRDGETALHGAARNDQQEAIKFLRENGANPEIFNKYGFPALFYAIKHSLLDTLKIFMGEFHSVANEGQEIIPDSILLKQVRTKQGYPAMSAVEYAAQLNYLDKVEYLVSLSRERDPADIGNFQRKSQTLALSWAVSRGNLVMAQYLLANRAKIEQDGLLHSAAELNNLPIWNLLDEHSTDLFAINNAEDEARVLNIKKYILKTAIDRSSSLVIPAMLEKYPELINSVADEDSVTPLHYAINTKVATETQAARKLEVVRSLLEYKATINIREQEALLYFVAGHGDSSLWNFAVEKSRYLLAVNKEEDKARVRGIQKNLITTAIDGLNAPVIRAMLEGNSALVNSIGDEDSITPLHHVIDARVEEIEKVAKQLEIVGILLDHGAPIDALHGNNSPRTLAVDAGRADIVNLLDSHERNILV